MVKHPYLSVTVCVPSGGIVTAATMKSLFLLASYFGTYKVPGVEKQKLSLISAVSSVIHTSRERMVKKVLQSDATHMLFVDSDMEFPMTMLHRMLAHEKDFVAANCTTRVQPVKTVAHDIQGKRMVSKGKTGLEQALYTGTAVMLVRTDVLKQLQPPLFLPDWLPEHQDYCGEDVYFTQKLVATGVTLWVDHELSLQIKHVGAYAYGHDDVEGVENGGVCDAGDAGLCREGVGCAPLSVEGRYGEDQKPQTRSERTTGVAGEGLLGDVVKGASGKAGLHRKPLCDALGHAFGAGQSDGDRCVDGR